MPASGDNCGCWDHARYAAASPLSSFSVIVDMSVRSLEPTPGFYWRVVRLVGRMVAREMRDARATARLRGRLWSAQIIH